jgi:hypothetical protein
VKTAAIVVLAFAVMNAAQAQYGQTQPPFGSDADVNAAKSLWRALTKAKLVGRRAIRGTPYKGTHPHGAVLTTLDAIVNVSGHEGVVIVKNNYGGREVSTRAVANDPGTYLQAITVMFKREAGQQGLVLGKVRARWRNPEKPTGPALGRARRQGRARPGVYRLPPGRPGW